MGTRDGSDNMLPVSEMKSPHSEHLEMCQYSHIEPKSHWQTLQWVHAGMTLGRCLSWSSELECFVSVIDSPKYPIVMISKLSLKGAQKAPAVSFGDVSKTDKPLSNGS
jgi:hypothetical protein